MLVSGQKGLYDIGYPPDKDLRGPFLDQGVR